MILSGVNKLMKQLDRYADKIFNKGRKINTEIAEKILAESRMEVPFKTGTLADSQFLVSEDDGTIRFGYGGPNALTSPRGTPVTDYMIRQHEDLSLNHETGKAKFLSDPFLRNIGYAQSKMVEDLSRVVP